MLTHPSGISARFQTTFHLDSPGSVAAYGIWTTQNCLCSPACGAGRPYVWLCPIFLVIIIIIWFKHTLCHSLSQWRIASLWTRLQSVRCTSAHMLVMWVTSEWRSEGWLHDSLVCLSVCLSRFACVCKCIDVSPCITCHCTDACCAAMSGPPEHTCIRGSSLYL